MRKGWFVAGCAALASNAVAADWYDLASSTKGAIWAIDPSSIKDVSDGYAKVRKVWIRIDYSSDKTEIARQAKVLVFFKCSEEKVKFVNWVNYKADGTVLSDISPPYPTYSTVVPESVISAIMEPVCSVSADKI